MSQILRGYAKVFQELESQLIADRAQDIFDIEKRLLRELLGCHHEVLSDLASPAVVLAHNLTPGEVAHLDAKFVLGFVTEVGGPGSHTAIVAEALEIPAVVGTGNFLADVAGGDLVIIDGVSGLVIVQPDDATLSRYRHEVEHHRSVVTQLEALRELPAETVDGQRIELMANIEFPREAEASLQRGASGVGLPTARGQCL